MARHSHNMELDLSQSGNDVLDEQSIHSYMSYESEGSEETVSDLNNILGNNEDEHDIEYHRQPLNLEIFDYYNSFEDEMAPVCQEHENDDILNTEPCAQSKPLINHIISNREPVSSARRMFCVSMEQSEIISQEFGLPKLDIQLEFPYPHDFSSYINRIRRTFVNQAGWNEVVINVNEFHGETGFITPLDLTLREMLKEFGGEDSLKSFSNNEKEGSRCYSTILDSELMEKDQNVMPVDGKALYFSLYADGTQLTSNRATEAIVFRVRIDNLPDAQHVWRTVGILVRKKNSTETEESGDTKRRVLHRLLFQIIKPLCVNPYILHKVCARMSCMVVDQPMERDLTCLKRANTFRNCTACRNMFGPSVEVDTVGNNADVIESGTKPIDADEEGSSQGVDDDNDDDVDESVAQQIDAAIDDHKEGLNADNGSPSIPFSFPSDGVQEFADENSFNFTPRSVKTTVGLQLELAVLRNVLVDGYSKEWPLYKTITQSVANANQSISEYMRDLKSSLRHECAREFPPVIACLPLLGSPPFRLYRSFSYDMLHVLDLGLIRNFADNVHLRVGDPSYRSNTTKGQLMNALNWRMMNLPSLPRVNRYYPFRSTINERQAPFTGAHWRNLVPFFWYVLLGLHQNKLPDQDDLFISALSLDRFYATLRQLNLPTDASRGFTVSNINQIEFYARTFCQQMKDLFDIPESTKQHRTIHHLVEYIKQYGNLSYGDTSKNESMHKGLKQSCIATNKKGASLG